MGDYSFEVLYPAGVGFDAAGLEDVAGVETIWFLKKIINRWMASFSERDGIGIVRAGPVVNFYETGADMFYEIFCQWIKSCFAHVFLKLCGIPHGSGIRSRARRLHSVFLYHEPLHM